MQICDITRSDEVVGEVTITPNDYSTNEEIKPIVLEVGQRALDAFCKQDWHALHNLTPASLRAKDPKRSEAAKKAGQTRAANRAKNAPEAAPDGPSEPSTANGGNAPTASPDDF